MSVEEDDDELMVGKDDLVGTIKIEVKVEADKSEDEEDWVPLVDPLSPSSDFTPATRRYETRKRHAKTVYEGSDDVDSDKASDWEPEEVELKVKTRQKNIQRIKIIKVEDGLSSASSQDGDDVTEPFERTASHPGKDAQRKRRQRRSRPTTAEERKVLAEKARVRRRKLREEKLKEQGNNDNGVTESLERTASHPGKDAQRKRRQRRSRPTTAEERKVLAEKARVRRRKLREDKLKEHSKIDKGNDDDVVTEPLERTSSQPGKDVQRKRRRQMSRPITDEERAERRRAYRRNYREQLKAAQFNVEAAEEDLEPGGVQRTQSYLERYEAQAAKNREQWRRALVRMTPEQRAERKRKAAMCQLLKKAAMTEEQRQEQRHKWYMRKVMQESKLSAEELEAMKEKRRARSREYKLKMTDEQREACKERARQYMKKRWQGFSPEERRRRIVKIVEDRKRTPQLRERYRQLNRISALRRKLVAAGLPPDQIAEKIRDFKANFDSEANPTARPARPGQRKTKSARAELPGPMGHRFRNAKRKLGRQLTLAGVPPEQIEEKIQELKAKYEKYGRLDGEGGRPPKLRPNETPEQREARLLKATIAVMKCKLRKRLTASGATPEEIEEKLRELVASYEAKAQTEITFRPHKPRAKQKRWSRGELEEVSTLGHSQDGAVRPTTEPQSFPSSPNSYCEPVEYSPPPVPDANPPQMYRGAIDMSPQRRYLRNQMFPEYSAHSVESFKFSLGNNTGRRGSSIVTPALGLTSLESKYTTPQWTPLPPPPHEQTPSIPPPEEDFSDGDWAEQDENSHSDQEKFVAPPPPRPKIPRRSPSGGTGKRRRGPRDGPRGPYKAKGPLVCCDECGVGYSAEYLPKHKQLVHNPNWVDGKCVACGMEFSIGAKFLVHYNSAHVYTGVGKVLSRQRFGPRKHKFMTAEEREAWKSRPVECKLCGISLSRSEIAEHVRVVHHDDYKEGKCSVCKKEFEKAVDFYEHFRREHRQGKRSYERKKDWICPQCGDGFHSSHYLSWHEYHVHGEGSKEENRPLCPFCGNKYSTTVSLKEHIKNVHPEEEGGLEHPRRQEWYCRRCVEKFQTNKELLEHVTAQHPDSYFPCPHPHCQRLMYTEQNLKDHLRICKVDEEDDGSRRFVQTLGCVPLTCEFCSKSMRLSSMKDHYRVVHGVVEQPWKCDYCPKIFGRRPFWLNHLDGKHGIPLDDELKEEARKLRVPDRSQVEVKNLKGHLKGSRKERTDNSKRMARKSRSPKESMSCSSAEDEEDSKERKMTRSRRGRRSHATPLESPQEVQVEKEKRLVISVERLDEKEINKWINKSDRSVSEV